MKRCFFIFTALLLGWQITVGQVDTLQQPVDTVVIDNSEAVDLMRRAQNEELASSLREAALTEQLASHGDNEQRKELERQLQEIRRADSTRQVNMQRQIDSLKRNATGAPVILGTDTVTLIYTRLGSFTPQERAEMNGRKILQTAKIFSFKDDSIVVMDAGSSHDIIYGATIMASITDLDALWMNKSRIDLATEYRDRILEAIRIYQANASVVNILKMIGLSLLVVAVFILLIIAVNYLFLKVIDGNIRHRKNKFLKGIRIRNLEILNAKKEMQVFLFLSKMVRYILYLVLIYLTLPILFSIFPMTQRLAQTLYHWISTPISAIFTGFVNYLPNLLKIIIIVIIFHYLIKFVRYIMKEIEDERLAIPGFYPDWAKATFNIIRIFLFAFALVMIYPLLPNSDSAVFQSVSVFIGIVVSLGSTSVIGNLLAGLVITYMRPFKIGDRIKVGDVSGDVVEKTPFVVRVETIKKEIITVPNLTILSSNVVNYSTSADEGVILYTTITMGYEIPQQKVYDLLITAALKTTHILSEPAPFVLSTSLGDNSASYQINAYTHRPELQATIYSELHTRILDAFHEAGVEMVIPHYRAVRDGNKSTLPPIYPSKKPKRAGRRADLSAG